MEKKKSTISVLKSVQFFFLNQLRVERRNLFFSSGFHYWDEVCLHRHFAAPCTEFSLKKKKKKVGIEEGMATQYPYFSHTCAYLSLWRPVQILIPGLLQSLGELVFFNIHSFIQHMFMGYPLCAGTLLRS